MISRLVEVRDLTQPAKVVLHEFVFGIKWFAFGGDGGCGSGCSESQRLRRERLTETQGSQCAT